MARDALSDEEVERFVEDGYLWLRGCFERERARAIVEQVFAAGGTLERCFAPETGRDHPVPGEPLSDTRAWGVPRVDCDTGFSIPIRELSPRLAAAIDTLLGAHRSCRASLGEKWILNLDHHPRPVDEVEREYHLRTPNWHIDTAGPRTTLVGRFDALTLLVLWSDVLEGGGGTLYSPDSLDRMVEGLAAAPDGLDTEYTVSSTPILDGCEDLWQMVGSAGDVLITHPFMLHAQPKNYRTDVRILENPTVMVERELDYRRDNAAPSPVERCVIRRLARVPVVRGPLREQELDRDLEHRAREALRVHHESHFYPYTPGSEDRHLAPVDRWLFESWLRRECRAIAFHARTLLDAVRLAVRRVRELAVSQRAVVGPTSACSIVEPASLADRAFATLTLGFANCEAMAYLVGRLLRGAGHSALPFEAKSGQHAHLLVLAWEDGRGVLVDAWGDHPAVWIEGLDVAALCDWREVELERPHIDGGLDGVPLYLSVAGQGGDLARTGLYPRDAFLGGRALEPWYFDGDDPDALRPSAEALAGKPRGDLDVDLDSPWQRFLALRMQHLDGALSDPGAAYATLLDDPRLKGATRQLVRALGVVADPARRPAPEERRRLASRAARAPIPAVDIEARMRAGDPSAWSRWDPRPIDAGDLDAAWDDVLARRGEPGVPPMIRAYTHFPYCVSSCNFCMYWHEVPKDQALHARYVDALIERVARVRGRHGRTTLDAAYFGGGTPTATPADELARYLDAFVEAFEVRGEFSVEGHPGVTTLEHIERLADAGVNRLSMGLQSFDEAVLRTITRRNAPDEEVAALIAEARARGMVVNVDLVIGLPGQDLDSFRRDLRRAADLGPDFVMMYRFEPVKRLPTAPAAEMRLERALSDDLIEALREDGYELADRLGENRRSTRLRRIDPPPRTFPDEETYAQFDDQPSHTIALGPGAYGHVFGRFWYREVTSMQHLETRRYLGTRLDAIDEVRPHLLALLERGGELNLARLERLAGVDVERAFADAMALGRERGLWRREGYVLGVADGSGRADVVDLIAPRSPERPLAELRDPAAEPQLVALRRNRGDAERDRAALLELCETLRVPTTGHQLLKGVWVGRRDASALSFHIGAPKAPPLQIQVSAPRGGSGFLSTDRFEISYATASGGPADARERRFLAWLRARLDKVGVARATP